MRDRLTKVKDIAKDVERGSRGTEALVYCVRALADEVRELKERVDEKRKSKNFVQLYRCGRSFDEGKI